MRACVCTYTQSQVFSDILTMGIYALNTKITPLPISGMYMCTQTRGLLKVGGGAFSYFLLQQVDVLPSKTWHCVYVKLLIYCYSMYVL